MTVEIAEKCPDSASGRHFWLDVTTEADRPNKRYNCRSCRKEVLDEPSSFVALDTAARGSAMRLAAL